MLAIKVHDPLHGFRIKRRCVTGITEVKLVQQLTFIEQCPRFGIFIDLQKAYDSKDWEWVVDILYKAGVDPKSLWLLILF